MAKYNTSLNKIIYFCYLAPFTTQLVWIWDYYYYYYSFSICVSTLQMISGVFFSAVVTQTYSRSQHHQHLLFTTPLKQFYALLSLLVFFFRNQHCNANSVETQYKTVKCTNVHANSVELHTLLLNRLFFFFNPFLVMLSIKRTFRIQAVDLTYVRYEWSVSYLVVRLVFFAG